MPDVRHHDECAVARHAGGCVQVVPHGMRGRCTSCVGDVAATVEPVQQFVGVVADFLWTVTLVTATLVTVIMQCCLDTACRSSSMEAFLFSAFLDTACCMALLLVAFFLNL